MAKDNSFDIVSEFDKQELRNAVDQTKKEITNRYDFKGDHVVIELRDETIYLEAASDYKLQAIHSSLNQKLVNRSLSPKILDMQKVEPTSNGNVKQEIKLITALDQENAKKITQMIRDNFPKAKGRIEGSTVRVTSPKRDELQAIIAHLKKSEEITAPLQFTNYR